MKHLNKRLLALLLALVMLAALFPVSAFAAGRGRGDALGHLGGDPRL